MDLAIFNRPVVKSPAFRTPASKYSLRIEAIGCSRCFSQQNIAHAGQGRNCRAIAMLRRSMARDLIT
jgi:hypothetical protein